MREQKHQGRGLGSKERAKQAVFRAAVVGASGYVGGELLRILCQHESFEIHSLMANTSAGDDIADHHPHLTPLAGQILAPTDASSLASNDVVFLALPHGESATIASELPEDVLVVDCSADFRLENAEEWSRHYSSSYAGVWPYGLPELPGQRQQLKEARRIAVPGCYPTAASLAIAPAFSAGLAEPDVVVVAVSGVSGAGRTLQREFLASEVIGGSTVYAAGGKHRHTPEIRQNLQRLVEEIEETISVSFTPVLVPMTRGIVATCSAPVKPNVDANTLRHVYETAYQDEPFVVLLPEGRWPSSANVVASNMVHVQIALDVETHRIVAVAAIDNLTKGTAGAAIQCANIALGIAETTGLPMIGVAP